MSKVVALWVVFQLVIIGYSYGDMHNAIVNKRYDCSLINEEVNPLSVAIIPLVVFVPESTHVTEYCHE